MIEIKKLTKIYDKQDTPALKGVTFSLPDKGMVFVLGKSGSGKSTLLNLLGGLDSITSGEINLSGNNLSQMKEEELSVYRNSCVGFVFQDFCLIDNLSVYDNIELSLALKSEHNPELVKETIDKVDLGGFENRPVKKLSGGQKQRVAIARALVKSPQIILADEPTGNLDSKTSKQIMQLLKKISKDNLVVVVSHNNDDAIKYADRIIEISDGKITRDVENTGTENKLVIDETSITLPYQAVLDDEQLEEINKSKDSRVIKQQQPQFVESKKIEKSDTKIDINKYHLKAKTFYKMSGNFLSRKWVGFTVTLIMISLISIILGLCQMFVTYNGERTIQDSFNNLSDNAFIVKKGNIDDSILKRIDTDKLGRITNEEIENFYSIGYKGKIYTLINATMGNYGSPLETGNNVNISRNFKLFYAVNNLGLLECDMDFLKKLFADENGEIDVLAGSLDYTTFKPYGMILTDYMADSFLFYHPDYQSNPNTPYQKLIDNDMLINRFAVSAVINTNYKTRYKELMDKYTAYFNASSKYQKDQLIDEILGSDSYADFYKEVTQYLAITYSINPNYRQDTITYANQSRIVGYFNSLDIYSETGELLVDDYTLQCDNYSWFMEKYGSATPHPEFENNEIYLSLEKYNEIFGTELTEDTLDEFQERTVIFKSYSAYRELDETPLYTKEYKVIGLSGQVGTFSLLTDEEFAFVRQYDVYAFGLYFDSPQNCNNFYTALKESDFYLGSQEFDAIYQIVDIVEVFKEYFSLVTTILWIAGIILLLSFCLNNIKNNKYQIGVLRAMGAKSSSIIGMFALHSLIAGVIITMLTTVGLFTLTGTANTIILEGFKSNIRSSALSLLEGVEILQLTGKILLTNIGVVIAMLFVASIVPLVLINRIKPIKIIKSKD